MSRLEYKILWNRDGFCTDVWLSDYITERHFVSYNSYYRINFYIRCIEYKKYINCSLLFEK